MLQNVFSSAFRPFSRHLVCVSKMLQNDSWFAKIGFDTAEKEFPKACRQGLTTPLPSATAPGKPLSPRRARTPSPCRRRGTRRPRRPRRPRGHGSLTARISALRFFVDRVDRFEDDLRFRPKSKLRGFAASQSSVSPSARCP